MDEKWWYALNSKYIFDNDTDRITNYSFDQLTQFYEKIKSLNAQPIKNCAKVLQNRHELKIQINVLKKKYDELILKHENLKEKENNIKEIDLNIKNTEDKILQFEKDSKNLSAREIDKKLTELNKELKEVLDKLDNEYTTSDVKELKDDNRYNTYCSTCEKNCHEPCDCKFNSFSRCKVFSWAIFKNKICEECSCPKTTHVTGKKKIVIVKKKIPKCNNEQKRKKEEEYGKKREEYIDKFDKDKNEIENNKRMYEQYKSQLLEGKTSKIIERNEIQKELNNINYQIIINLIKLQSLNEQINYLAMNTNHLEIESKYIDSLCKKMEEMGKKNENQYQLLKQIKDNNVIFNQIKDIDCSKLDYTQIAAQLGFLKPKEY